LTINFLAQIRKIENGVSTILLPATPKPAKPEIPPTLVALGNTTQEDDG
jgi:hypothetical protein